MRSKFFSSTQILTLTAMMLTLTVILSILENMIPILPYLPPGVRIGLANIVIMYSLFFIGKRYAILLSIIKSIFILTTRGVTSAILSLCGGLLSIFIIIILIAIFKNKISFIILSIFGAIFHNIGQLTAISIILGDNTYIYYYLPILLISGIIMGCITGTLLKVLIPAFNGVFPIKNNCNDA